MTILPGGRWVADYNENNVRGTYFQHPDALGSVTEWSDQNGNLTVNQLFYPFGQSWIGQPGGGAPTQFAGMEHRNAFQLDVTPNREYNSKWGRWLTPDPGGRNAVRLDDPQTWNMYSYVRNSPTTLTDPSGLLEANPGSTAQEEQEQAEGDAGHDPQSNSTSGGATPTDPNSATGWSLSWQLSASANFLGQELIGVTDATVTPLVDAVEHPVDTLEAAANAVEHPVDTATSVVSGAVDTVKAAASGDPRAIGQVVGVAATVAYTAGNVEAGAYEHGGGGVNLQNTPLNGNRIALDYHPFGKAGTATASRNVLHVDIKIQQLGINVRHWTLW